MLRSFASVNNKNENSCLYITCVRSAFLDLPSSGKLKIEYVRAKDVFLNLNLKAGKRNPKIRPNYYNVNFAV